MGVVYKVLGQSNPGAAALTDVYTVPAATSAVVSSIIIVNRSATPTSFRISLAVAGAADDNKQYIAFDTPIGANQIVSHTPGIGLAATDVVRVYATLATLTFSVLGTELT